MPTNKKRRQPRSWWDDVLFVIAMLGLGALIAWSIWSLFAAPAPQGAMVEQLMLGNVWIWDGFPTWMDELLRVVSEWLDYVCLGTEAVPRPGP